MNKESSPLVQQSESMNSKFLLIKIGGHALIKPAALTSLCQAILKLHLNGYKLLLTHGGGPQITQALQDADIETKFIDGFRHTSAEAMMVVKDVLCGAIQHDVVKTLQTCGVVKSIAFCGDDNVIFAKVKTKNTQGINVDLGYVGDVLRVDTAKVVAALVEGFVVVLSAIGKNDEGVLLNINADSAAAALAIDLNVDELILLTDVEGIYSDWPNGDSLLSELSLVQAQELLPKLNTGMVPKLESAITAVASGVPQVRILSGTDGSALLLSQFQLAAIGTVIS